MDNPLVSVIVPCYNHEKYVEECILSIVHQTYSNIELIVIDDGSKDSSPEILKKLQEQYGFTLECQQNMGLSRTLNKAAVKYGHGKYISYLASDDYWAKDKIEQEVAFMESHPEIGLVYGKAYIISKSGNIVEPPPLDARPAGKVTFEELFVRNRITALTTLFRRDVFDEVGRFNENTPIEDWDLWLRIAAKYPVYFMDSYMGYYREHMTNSSGNSMKMITAIDQILDSWKDKVPSGLYKKSRRNASLNALRILSRNHKKEARKYLTFDVASFFDKRFYMGVFKLIFR
jgi:glycosyltransferase involved in cell wall biosynthesis